MAHRCFSTVYFSWLSSFLNNHDGRMFLVMPKIDRLLMFDEFFWVQKEIFFFEVFSCV